MEQKDKITRDGKAETKSRFNMSVQDFLGIVSIGAALGFNPGKARPA